MDDVLLRLKESIGEQKRNLLDWLNATTAHVREIRSGPAGEEGVQQHLYLLDTALERAENKTLGVCTVCDEYVDTSRLEMDYTSSVCIEHLTGEERSRLESELELSQKVQRALLPHRVPEIPGLEVAAFSQPAHIVGGDYFDFLRFKDGSHAIVIADVMGKGMPASMLMASLQASLQILAPEHVQPAEVVARLNYLFCHNIRLTKFVTFFLARYDDTTGALTYCNAGHNPPLLHRAGGGIEPLLPTGAAIGLVEQVEFGQSSVQVQSGDRLILYTDGVVEWMNDQRELFGESRVMSLLQESKHLSPQRTITELRERLHLFAAAQTPADDTTIIVVQAK